MYIFGLAAGAESHRFNDLSISISSLRRDNSSLMNKHERNRLRGNCISVNSVPATN
jgi:hypothetical protein